MPADCFTLAHHRPGQKMSFNCQGCLRQYFPDVYQPDGQEWPTFGIAIDSVDAEATQ